MVCLTNSSTSHKSSWMTQTTFIPISTSGLLFLLPITVAVKQLSSIASSPNLYYSALGHQASAPLPSPTWLAS